MLDGWIDTQVAVDLDDMMKVCRLAKQKGYGSREYLEFTTMMLDSFSHIYKTCQIINQEQPNIRDKLVSLELENKTLREALGTSRHLAYMDSTNIGTLSDIFNVCDKAINETSDKAMANEVNDET